MVGENIDHRLFDPSEVTTTTREAGKGKIAEGFAPFLRVTRKSVLGTACPGADPDEDSSVDPVSEDC